jgi:ABC-type glutathione transport system ATPase component
VINRHGFVFFCAKPGRRPELQRAVIARALISLPALIVVDEPVSMIDASMRMAIVNLRKRLRDELKVSITYITYDLATAYYISDRVLIMQKGKVVETGPARDVSPSASSLHHPTERFSLITGRRP